MKGSLAVADKAHIHDPELLCTYSNLEPRARMAAQVIRSGCWKVRSALKTQMLSEGFFKSVLRDEIKYK